MQASTRQKTLYLTQLATLSAMVLFLQLAGITIRIGATPVSLVLLPITLGALLLGPAAGAWLGFLFGAEVVIVCGVMGTDPFTAILFQDHPVLTTLLCLGKGVAAGLVPALVYRALKRAGDSRLFASKGIDTLALFVAAASAPIANTGIFILGSYTMMDTFQTNFLGEHSMFYFLVIICAGWNFIFEFLLNLLCTPVLSRVLQMLLPAREK